MRSFQAVGLVLLLCGCAGADPGDGTAAEGTRTIDRVAQSDGVTQKIAAAKVACAEMETVPGTGAYNACVKRLLRDQDFRRRRLADALANRAAKRRYTCVDEPRLRLVRCYDI